GEEISEPIQLENYSAIADYKKVQSNEVSLESGDIVEVIEKNDSGWWFVSLDEEQGWVPATFLQKCDNDEPNEDFVSVDTNQEKYITTHSFEAQSGDELSLNIGVILDVVQKSLDGWWFAKYQDKEGWVPATYLKKVYNQNDIEIKLPTEKIRTMMDVSQFKKGPKHEDQAA
ncbi:SH3 and PX domain-containing protein 2B-like, partial [Saccoglossus kowalevskii]